MLEDVEYFPNPSQNVLVKLRGKLNQQIAESVVPECVDNICFQELFL